MNLKRGFLIFFSVTALFVLLTKLTITTDSIIDGDDQIGFPFKFYTYIGGKLLDESTPRTSINYWFLFLDILIYSLSLMLAMFLFRKRKA